MQEIIQMVENDSVAMLFAIIAGVVLLIIFLVLLVSFLKVKSYKDKFWNLEIDNVEKEESIDTLRQDLQNYILLTTSQEEDLKDFERTKQKLTDTAQSLKALKSDFNALKKEFSKKSTQFNTLSTVYQDLEKEYRALEDNYQKLNSDNSKLNMNNARLLRKLENDSRGSSKGKRQASVSSKTKTLFEEVEAHKKEK